MNIFEQATRMKLRFVSLKGELSVEQLWDLPLVSKSNFDLDSVARTVNHELKAQAEESFVTTRANPAKARLELALEVVKHVIATKIEEANSVRKAQENKEQRDRLLSILDKKEDEALAALTPEQIRAKLAELG